MDFEEASREWRKNKRRKGSRYIYKKKTRWWVGCQWVRSSGKECGKKTEREAGQAKTVIQTYYGWTEVSRPKSDIFCKQHRQRGEAKRRYLDFMNLLSLASYPADEFP